MALNNFIKKLIGPTPSKTSSKKSTVRNASTKRVSPKKTSSTLPSTQKKPLLKQKQKPVLTPKSKTSQEVSLKKYLVIAYGPKKFKLNDGRSIESLVELQEMLPTMSESVYSHHVGSNYNHFADWIEAVLEDPKCAESLRKSTNPKETLALVKQHLRDYAW